MKKFLFLLLLMSVTALPVIGRQPVQPNPLFEKVTFNAIQDRLKRKKTPSRSKRSFFSTEFEPRLILVSDSKRTKPFIEQALAYKKAGITHLTRYPSSDTAFGSRAKAKTCLGDHLGAFDDLSKALEIRPDDRYYMLDRANIPNRVPDTTKALELFQIVIDDNNKLVANVRNTNLAITYKSLLASSYVGRSFIYRKIGDKDKQLADLSSAVEVYPDPNLRYRASTYHGYKMFDLAISDATAYIRLQEQRYGPRFNQKYLSQDYVYRAKLYSDAGKISEAISDYQKAIELSPENRASIETQISLLKQRQ